MTTNTTNSQAASIAGDAEFDELLGSYVEGIAGKFLLWDYIDTKLAQAREEGRREGLKQQLMLNGQFGCTHNCNQGRDCTCG